MSAELLHQHFKRLSEAPDAIPSLRRFILDLAVRGKLVDQDANDEPATELLKRIQTEKARRIKLGEIRAVRGEDNIDEFKALYQIPSIWGWVRLSSVGLIIGGGTPPSGDLDNFAEGGKDIPWLTPADLGKHRELLISHGARDLSQQGLASSSATLLPTGSVLFTSRAPIGYIAIASNQITTNQGFKSVIPYINELSRFIALYFQAFAPWIDSKASGTTFREVSGKIVAGLPFPLPPLAEQHRIVAKVDELMALCDQLEAAKAEREKNRDRLVTASLQRLNKPTDDEEAFRTDTRFTFNHLPRITTRLAHIKQLRQTILNLAVCGKLVPQDPNDEPASELLKRIQAEKGRLVKEGKIKSEKVVQSRAVMPVVSAKLPEGWFWSHIQNVCTSVTDGDHLAPPKSETGIPFLVIGNVRSQIIEFVGCRHVPDSYYKQLDTIRRPNKGDVLYTLVGSYGIPVIVRDTRPFCVQRHIGILRPSKYVNLDFLARILASKLVFDQATECATGIAQKTVPLAGLRAIRIPLPPLSEQRRIVAKVDELMALCDQLETQLNTTEIDSRRLLEAVLHEALAPALEKAA